MGKTYVQTATPNPITANGADKKSYRYHFYTIWLFTLNDMKSIVYPETVFGVFSALSGNLLTTNNTPDLLEILSRIPKVLLWNWLNLLIFNIANQRLSESIVEDSVNKPWRPIPAQRLSPEEARRLLLWVIPFVALTMVYLGGMQECIAMVALTWIYNDLGGADESYILRNLINAFGFMCYSSGSTIVAAGYSICDLNERAYSWLAIIGCVVFSTLQMQDMADVHGDMVRGRRTLPLVHGQRTARWSIALPVIFWSLICPMYWQVGLWAYALPIATGSLLAFRILCLRSADADRKTWKMWCVWTSTLYLLPICKDYSVFERFIGSDTYRL